MCMWEDMIKKNNNVMDIIIRIIIIGIIIRNT